MDGYQNPIEAQQGTNFQVWKLPGRTKIPLRRGVYCINRLGLKADGPLSNRLKHPPPVARLCSPWEVLGFLETPHRLGHPPTIHADAA